MKKKKEAVPELVQRLLRRQVSRVSVREKSPVVPASSSPVTLQSLWDVDGYLSRQPVSQFSTPTVTLQFFQFQYRVELPLPMPLGLLGSKTITDRGKLPSEKHPELL